MGIHHSRSAEPLPEARPGAAMGTWGLWLTIVVLAAFVAGLAAAALYLHTGQLAWPPEGIEAPGRTRAVLAVALAVAGSILVTASVHRMRAGLRGPASLLLAASAGTLTASVLVMVNDLATSGFRWDEHGYTSVYWSLTGASITFVGAAVLVVGAALVQTVVGLIDEDRHLELTNAAIYAWFSAATALVLLALVHLLPAATGGAA